MITGKELALQNQHPDQPSSKPWNKQQNQPQSFMCSPHPFRVAFKNEQEETC